VSIDGVGNTAKEAVEWMSWRSGGSDVLAVPVNEDKKEEGRFGI
ncbi:hypothetical protein Tco_1489631, partial [Tanacetum coccineum]